MMDLGWWPLEPLKKEPTSLVVVQYRLGFNPSLWDAICSGGEEASELEG